MQKLTKQLRRDWANFQRMGWGWKSFKDLAATLYKTSPKEVANRVAPK